MPASVSLEERAWALIDALLPVVGWLLLGSTGLALLLLLLARWGRRE